jgi:hypothetical protein
MLGGRVRSDIDGSVDQDDGTVPNMSGFPASHLRDNTIGSYGDENHVEGG